MFFKLVITVFIIFQHGECIKIDVTNNCKVNFWLNKNTCEPCKCNPKGSESLQCQPPNGQCKCVRSFGGQKCDKPCGECFDNWDKILTEKKYEVEREIKIAQNIPIIDLTSSMNDLPYLYETLDRIESVLNNKTAIDINTINEKINALQKYFKQTEFFYEDLEQLLNNNKILNKQNKDNLVKYLQTYSDVKKTIANLTSQNTKLEESNLQGALKLTEEAKKQADDIVYRASVALENLKNFTINIIEQEFQDIFKKNEEDMKKLQDNLSSLNMTFNSFDLHSASADLNNALSYGDKTTKILEEKQSNFSKDGNSSVDYKNLAKEAQESYNKAVETHRDYNVSKAMNEKLSRDWENFGKLNFKVPNLEDLRKNLTGIQMKYSEKFIKELAENIRTTAENYNNVVWILETSKKNLTFAEKLKEDAESAAGKVEEVRKVVTVMKLEMKRVESAQKEIQNNLESLMVELEGLEILVENENKIKEVEEQIEENVKLLEELDALFKNLLEKIDNNKILAVSLETQSDDIIKQATGRQKVADDFLVAYNEMKNVVKTREVFFGRADEAVVKSEKLAKMILDLSPGETDGKDDKIEVLEKNISDLLVEMKKYEKDIAASIKKAMDENCN